MISRSYNYNRRKGGKRIKNARHPIMKTNFLESAVNSIEIYRFVHYITVEIGRWVAVDGKDSRQYRSPHLNRTMLL
jgi:hypothetical protein